MNDDIDYEKWRAFIEESNVAANAHTNTPYTHRKTADKIQRARTEQTSSPLAELSPPRKR